MNKTVTVNIGGIVFHIDENAYEKFKSYLESIRLHFTSAEGRDEIMQDIEARIAEMFQERVTGGKQVITLMDVEDVTYLMGRPDQINDEPEGNSQADSSGNSTFSPKEESEKNQQGNKRLFRNPDDKVLGGVCSGVAAYFDVDPVWVRLLFAFVFFVFGSGFILYILLWIIVPEADSSLEKLKMRGSPVNISNIEKNVNEGSKSKKSTMTSRVFESFATLIKFFFLFIGKVIAVFFLFIGLVVFLALCFSLLVLFKIPGVHFPIFIQHVFPDGFQFGLAFLAAVVLVAIPFLMLAYAGARMLFNIKRSSRIFGFTALGIWLLSLGVCIFLGIRIASEFSQRTNIRQVLPITQPRQKYVRLELDRSMDNPGKDYDDDWDSEDWNNEFYFSDKDGHVQSGNIKMDIVKSLTDSFEVQQIFYAHGSSKKNASENASHISYSVTQMDSLIRFSKYFHLDSFDKFRGQKVQILLKAPVGAKIYLDPSLKGFIYDVDNIQNVYDHDMLGKNWEMTTQGLNCLDCTGSEDTIDGKNGIHINKKGQHIRIDNNGVYISGKDENGEEAFVKIDSNGVQIKSNGKSEKVN